MIRIAVVDDHPLVREGVAAVLTVEPDLAVSFAVATAEAALCHPDLGEIDVAVVDVRLGGRSGIELCAALRSLHPHVRVLIITAFAHEGVVLNAFEAGARGILVKGSDPSGLRRAVRAVLEGTYIDPSLVPRFLKLVQAGPRAKGPFGLTRQEMRVLELLPRGLTNRQIAELLGVSVHTARDYVYRALRKLQASDRTEAAAIAIREGLA